MNIKISPLLTFFLVIALGWGVKREAITARPLELNSRNSLTTGVQTSTAQIAMDVSRTTSERKTSTMSTEMMNKTRKSESTIIGKNYPDENNNCRGDPAKLNSKGCMKAIPTSKPHSVSTISDNDHDKTESDASTSGANINDIDDQNNPTNYSKNSKQCKCEDKECKELKCGNIIYTTYYKTDKPNESHTTGKPGIATTGKANG